MFIGKTDAEAEAPILCSSDAKDWLLGKDPDAGKDWRQEEKGKTEDAMLGWHHWLDGHEFEQAQGVGDGQGSLACCSPWGCKGSDMTATELTERYWYGKMIRKWKRDFLGGPVAKTPYFNSQTQGQSSISELDPTCGSWKSCMSQQRSHMPTTKTHCSQIDNFF